MAGLRYNAAFFSHVEIMHTLSNSPNVDINLKDPQAIPSKID